MTRKTTLPSTLPGLRAWLKGSEQGRALLAELTEEAFEKVIEDRCRACQNIRPHPKVLSKVLVVQRRLGRFPGVMVYAEEGTSVRLLELPDMRADAEDYIELLIPKSWRHLMGLPAKRIHSDVFRGISLTEWLRYAELGEALREIRSVYGRATENP